MHTRTSPSVPDISTSTVSPNDLKLIGTVAAIRPAARSRRLMIPPAMMSASSARRKASALVIWRLSSTLLPATPRLLALTRTQRLPAVPVHDLVDGDALRGLEVFAREVAHRDQRGLCITLIRDPQQLCDLSLVLQVKRGPGGAHPPHAGSEHERPGCREDR